MGKKIFGLLVVGLVVALVIPVGSCDSDFDSELSAIGVIRIDTVNSEIKGFVLFGDNDGETLQFTFIAIKFDNGRMPEVLDSKMPLLIHHINYNPLK
ncbi:hypothetical protein AYK25_01765 [Thermoplasmatales archaeon SM1-50]|nr:MAG: hypothetical protein AYK25_01765 [Thermoplasmatales archaeon SM1-50]